MFLKRVLPSPSVVPSGKRPCRDSGLLSFLCRQHLALGFLATTQGEIELSVHQRQASRENTQWGNVMAVRDEVDELLKVSLFAGIERDRLRLLAFTSIEPVAYEAGQLLFREGDAPDSAYVVVEGSVEILTKTPRGEAVFATIGKDGIVGETSLLSTMKRRVTARAAEPLRVLRISKDLFERLLAECPDVGVKILRTMAMQYDRLFETMLLNFKESAGTDST